MTWLDELEVESGREVNPFGGSNELEGRDGACTPKWLADALGKFDIDPCSNLRSHVKATLMLVLSQDDDGLYGEPGQYKASGCIRTASHGADTFINPPYAAGQVIRWVQHWCDVDFTFLLRWDPSTKWFAKLWPRCWGAWFPRERINFDPPPGVKFSSNPFPHALYFKHSPGMQRYGRLKQLGYFVENR